MALIRHTPTELVVEISDKTVMSTIIKRKASLHSLQYQPVDKTVKIGLMVYPFAVTSGGTFGEPLSDVQNFRPYYKELIANMGSLVNAQTGELIGEITLLDDPTSFEVDGILDGIDYMYEYEFYKMLASSQPVIIDNLIIAKVQQADATGKI